MSFGIWNFSCAAARAFYHVSLDSPNDKYSFQLVKVDVRRRRTHVESSGHEDECFCTATTQEEHTWRGSHLGIGFADLGCDRFDGVDDLVPSRYKISQVNSEMYMLLKE